MYIIIVCGLNEFHKRGILHNDLKEENIVIVDDNDLWKINEGSNERKYPHLKLIDLGLSEEETIILKETTKRGTMTYFVYYYNYLFIIYVFILFIFFRLQRFKKTCKIMIVLLRYTPLV